MNPENSDTPAIPAAPAIDPVLTLVEPKSNFPLAAAAGAGAAIVGAALWAAVTVAVEIQIGWMAVGLGFLVGYAVGHFNRERDPSFGYLGAGLSLFGCLLGNWFTILGFVSAKKGAAFFSLLFAVNMTKIPGIMMDAFSPMDLLFYGIAVYQGYKFSARGPAKK